MATDKVSSIIVKVIQKTVQGEIVWNAFEPPENFEDGLDDIIPLLYIAHYKEKYFAVFLRRFKYYKDDVEYYWDEKKCFAFLSGAGDKVIWEVSDRRPILNDLYATVSENAAGIDNILDQLFDE